MKTVPVGDMVALVDDADYEEVIAYKWVVGRWRGARTYYAVRYLYSEQISMHRQLMRAQKGHVVDHVNGNGLDNQRLNIRFVTPSQNAINKHVPPSGRSGFRGVAWNNSCGKWQAQISVEHRYRYLGLFDSKELAAIAYNSAARELHGSFAKLNPVAECELPR